MKQQYRVVLRAATTLRAPGAVVAVIEDAKGIGGSEFFNDAGELFFTLPNTHESIAAVLPWETHWALEKYSGEGWKEINAGWVIDMDSADQETIFYGLDYIGVLGLLVDERFNPDESIDAVAELYPADPDGTGGAKYVENTITEIVTDQLERAIAGENSPLGFFDSVTVADMPEVVSIYATMKERLPLIKGLLDSHRAGTGRRTRLRVRKVLTWVDDLTYTAAYSFVVEDNPGEDRDNLRMEYGGFVQGYRTIPFGDFGTRVLAIGKTPIGFQVEYTTVQTPPPTGEAADYNETRYGNLPKIMFEQDIADTNDLKRRAARYAQEVGAIGKQVGLGLRVDVLTIKDGWDICDSFPVVIDRGPIDTSTWPTNYMTCFGWVLVVNDDGHSEAILTLQPKAEESEPDAGIIGSDPVIRVTKVEVHDSDPVDPPADWDITWINSVTGHVWQVDPVTGEWVDKTALGEFSAIGQSEPVPVDHDPSGANVTLDYDDGAWHRIVLDQPCSITVTGFDVDKGQVMVVEVSGTDALTWDADVDFGGADDQPNASGDTVFLLVSSVGSSAIRGAKFGSGGGITVQDEGVSLATLGEVLNFVGSGVTATGTGSTKTITITSGATLVPVMVEDGATGLWYVAVTGDGDAVMVEA